MSKPVGTNIGAPIVCTDTGDTYPTHYASYGKGGLMSVADTTARDAIYSVTPDRWELGMLVYVQNVAKYYRGYRGESGGMWIEVDLSGDTGTQGATGLQGATGIGTAGAQGATGVAGTAGSQGATGVQGVAGAAGAQGVTGVGGLVTLVATGLTGLTAGQVLVGNATQSAGLAFTGGYLAVTGMVKARYGTFGGGVNNLNAGLTVGIDGGNEAIIFEDLDLGGTDFDNKNANDTAGTGAVGKFIGGGASTDGGLIMRAWGATGVPALSLQGIISSDKGPVTYPAVTIIGQNTNAGAVTGIIATGKLLSVRNYTTDIITVKGDGDTTIAGDLSVSGTLSVSGNVYTVGFTGISTGFIGQGTDNGSNCYIMRVGNQVDFWFYMAGVSGGSNVTGTRSITLPWTATAPGTCYFSEACQCYNSATPSMGFCRIDNGSNILHVNKDPYYNAATSWVAPGTSVAYGHIRYYTTSAV